MSTPAQRPRGKGSCTVQPIRDKRHINAIKGVLAEKPRDFALFMLGIHTGYRGGDLLALRWGDVLTDAGEIADRVALVESKTAKRRELPLQENAQRALAALLRHEGPVARESYVFRSRQGTGRLTTGRLHQMVNEWAAAAGVPVRLGTHSMRKTFGYHLRQAGYDIAVIMEIFGHSNQAVTRRYLGIMQDEIDEATLRLKL